MTVKLLDEIKNFQGLSTDTKPTVGVCVGSRLIELDTRKKFRYDGAEWHEINDATDVFIQDQTTPPFDLFFIQQLAVPTSTRVQTFVDNRAVLVVDASNISVGDYLGIFYPAEDRFFFGEVLTISVNDLTVDTPLDFEYPIGATVVPFTRDLNVDGSIAKQIFAISGGGTGSELVLDITRLMISMECDSAVNLNKFGDLDALTIGVVLRRTDGTSKNIWNIKTNSELANLCYDYTPYAATNPVQFVDGAKFRYSFSGQDKHGVAVRLAPGDFLQIVIQDDLTGLVKFRIIAEGHEVD